MTSCAGQPLCSEGCGRPAAPRHKRCWGHLKRVTRKQSLETPLAEAYSSPWERLTAAALAYADADDGDDESFARARDRLRKAAVAYGRALLLRPELAPAPRARKDRSGAQLEFWPEVCP